MREKKAVAVASIASKYKSFLIYRERFKFARHPAKGCGEASPVGERNRNKLGFAERDEIKTWWGEGEGDWIDPLHKTLNCDSAILH